MNNFFGFQDPRMRRLLGNTQPDTPDFNAEAAVVPRPPELPTYDDEQFNKYASLLGQQPEREPRSMLARIAAGLIGGAVGLGNPGAGMATAKNLLEQPHEARLAEWARQSAGARELAGLENSRNARKTSQYEAARRAYDTEMDNRRADKGLGLQERSLDLTAEDKKQDNDRQERALKQRMNESDRDFAERQREHNESTALRKNESDRDFTERQREYNESMALKKSESDRDQRNFDTKLGWEIGKTAADRVEHALDRGARGTNKPATNKQIFDETKASIGNAHIELSRALGLNLGKNSEDMTTNLSDEQKQLIISMRDELAEKKQADPGYKLTPEERKKYIDQLNKARIVKGTFWNSTKGKEVGKSMSTLEDDSEE